jgi:hypothetical protein
MQRQPTEKLPDKFTIVTAAAASQRQPCNTHRQRANVILFLFLCKHGIGIWHCIGIGKGKTSFDWIYSFCSQHKHGHGIYRRETNHEKEETTPCLPLSLRVLENPHQSRPLASASSLRLSLVERVALRDTAARIAKTLHRPVVRPSGELLLHRLTEHGAFDVAVCRRLAGEFLVEVGRVALVEHRRLERGLVLAVEKLAPVYAVEEWVCLLSR